VDSLMNMEENDATQTAQCAVYLKALADPTRLKLVKALQCGPLSVSDLSELLELEIANVSHHLRVLYHANLVTTERSGKYIYYHLNKDFWRSRTVTTSLDFGCCKLDLRD
jgi:DNA-binding transcriptional ArsR family regulator